MAKRSAIENKLALHIRAVKLPEPVEEFEFHPSRKWRFDFAWPDLKIAAECEGAIGIRKSKSGKVYSGRHTSKDGFEADLEKYNEAILHGWDVLRFSATTVSTGRAVNMLEQVVALKNEQLASQAQAETEIDIPGIQFDGALGDLVSAIGVGSVLALTRRLGGGEYYVPKVPKTNHPLTLALGISTCNRLCAHYAGSRIEIPTKGVFRELRDRAISRALSNGVDQNVLAAQFGLTCRHIRNIRAQGQAAIA